MAASMLFLLPLMIAVTAILAFGTSYMVAVLRGDVYPWWPYISDTGTTVPESCIFGEFLTLTAILGLMTVYIRFKWIQSIKTQDRKVQILNLVAVVIGTISCVAMTFVANFQETSVRAVHMPSSAVTFGCAVAYNTLHAFITRRITPTHASTYLWILRLSLAITGILAIGLLYGFGVTADSLGQRTFGNDSRKRLEWNPSDPGWGLHLVSTINEWIVGLSIILYFLSFTKDFSKIKLNIKPECMSTENQRQQLRQGEDDDVEPLWSGGANTTRST